MEELASKEIEVMRVWTQNGSVEETFSSEQSKAVMNSIKCLMHYEQ